MKTKRPAKAARPARKAAPSPEALLRLQHKAYELRKKLLTLTGKIGGAHIGGSFSMMEMCVALYYHYLNVDPKEPKKADRDLFILSKGHAGVGLCVLLGDRGFFPEEELDHFNQTGSHFGIHPDHKAIAGVEASTGSLGHGLGLGLGMAIAKKLDRSNQRVVVLISDGELCEGSVWEAVLAAAHHEAGNLTCVVDYNNMSQDGPLTKIMDVAPVAAKFKAFGWRTQEINGHDLKQVTRALHALPPVSAKQPTCIVMNTVKGKGVSWMEDSVTWHYGGLDTATETKALGDLEKAYKKVTSAHAQLLKRKKGVLAWPV